MEFSQNMIKLYIVIIQRLIALEKNKNFIE